MIQQAYAQVLERIANAAAAAERQPKDIRLIAVSKTKSAVMIEEMYQTTAQRDFGENYADEMLAKAAQLKHLPDLRWVYIGQLQSNKIKRVMACAHEIQTLASEKHARLAERTAIELNKSSYPVWIEVNAGGEATKHGIGPDEVMNLAAFITKECPHLMLQGIMAIPPHLPNLPPEPPELYRALKQIALAVGGGNLSLGMTDDLEYAIGAGSDVVRIGTALFGARPLV